MLVYAVLATVVAVLTGCVYSFKKMRSIDQMTLIFSIVMKFSLPIKLLTRMGFASRIRPTLTEISMPGGHKFLASSSLYEYYLGEITKFKSRENDIYIATYPKAGTTWCQEIVWLLCNNADVERAKRAPIYARVPFLESIDVGEDNKGLQTLEKWPRNKDRIIKTHLSFELLPDEVKAGGKCKIIYLARNPKDVCVSYYFFHKMFITGMPDPGTWEEFLTRFCSGKVCWGNWFQHNLSYWKKVQENDERIYFTTFENLKKDFPTELRSLAKFLGKEMTQDQYDVITRHCSFESMSENKSTNYSGMQSIAFDFKESKFMRKGNVGDWKNYFTVNQNAAFDELYQREMKGSGLEIPFE